MLYDPKWQKPEVKADPFSLESLIAWLEMQPRHKSYDFFCQGECLVGQWALSIDTAAGPADGHGASFYIVNGKVRDFSRFVNHVANSGSDSFTFGAALDRARAMAAR